MKNFARTPDREAVTAVEVLVSLVVVGVALVPVLSASIATGRQTGFTRAHALAQVHAASQLESVAARGFRALTQAAARGDALTAGAALEALPFEIRAERIAFCPLAGDLGVLTVNLTWRQPGEPVDRRVSAFRFLGAADASWTVANPLPAPETDTTPAD